MDIVITYVNGLDPIWRDQYVKFVGDSILEKHFRDWGTLKYLLRGIERNMPFIDNVFLVVSGPSQVPDWVSGKLRIVYHKDIIPEQFLPLFNAASIEMFLHRIPGLDERFIYFNDDFFPVSPSAEEDFFEEGKAKVFCSKHWFKGNTYKHHCFNSDRLARKIAGTPAGRSFIRPQHMCAPMLKSQNEFVFKTAEDYLMGTISRIRTTSNCNQYLFTDYLFYSGRTIQHKMSKKHFSMATSSPAKIAAFLSNPDCKLVCINDVQMSDEKYKQFREVILDSFDRLFPEKSQYEK